MMRCPNILEVRELVYSLWPIEAQALDQLDAVGPDGVEREVDVRAIATMARKWLLFVECIPALGTDSDWTSR